MRPKPKPKANGLHVLVQLVHQRATLYVALQFARSSDHEVDCKKTGPGDFEIAHPGATHGGRIEQGPGGAASGGQLNQNPGKRTVLLQLDTQQVPFIAVLA